MFPYIPIDAFLYMSTPKNYEGKFVFIEASDKAYSFQNGEYFVVRQTPGTLYCAKIAVGYDGSETKQFALIGEKPVTVVESWANDTEALAHARDLIAWGEQINTPSFRKQWVDSVYTRASETGKTILRTIEKRRLATIESRAYTAADVHAWGEPWRYATSTSTEIKPRPTLEQRVQAIEDRENKLAVLYREATETEVARNHRAAVLRAAPSETRWRTSPTTGRKICSFGRPLLKDDPEYRELVQRWEGIMNAIRRIRSASLPA